jgi:hypothetical protein
MLPSRAIGIRDEPERAAGDLRTAHVGPVTACMTTATVKMPGCAQCCRVV